VKNAFSVFLLLTLAASLFLVVSIDSGSAMVPTYVNGVIAENTTWAVEGSPYIFTGAVGVSVGVTLMVEAGVTVDLSAYYMQVNGTLVAEGTDYAKVVFTSNQEQTYAPANDWVNTHPISSGNKNIILAYGNSTCKLENAILHCTSLFGQGLYSSATITLYNCSLFDSSVNNWGKSSIANSYVTGTINLKGASTLSGNTLLGGVDVSGGWADTLWAGDFAVSSNNITNSGDGALMAAGSGIIQGNLIWGTTKGIMQNDGTLLSATIAGNLIRDNEYGIYLRNEQDTAVIKGNAITGNKVGIFNPGYQVTITGNTFTDNELYSIRAGSSAVSAKDNWWGTSDRAAIGQSIYDSNDDFSLGTVVFVPYLTDATCIPSELAAYTVTPSPLDSISYQAGGQASMTVLGGLEIGVIATVAIIAILVAVVALRVSRKSRR
jgi:parallel beta-helix repeat protein